MSDSEDDYMSDKVLMECQEDIRPGLLFTREKRKHEIFKKRDEYRNKRLKPLRVVEQETRDQGLETAITSENRGFKLLEKMGFKPGEGLGKSNSGIKEPINVVVKQGTSGVGRQSYQQELLNKKRELRYRRIRERENLFVISNKEKSFQLKLRKDFLKAQKVCEELDFRINVRHPVEDFYWTKATIKMKRKEERETVESDEDEDSDDDDEFENNICEENLNSIIDYLRNTHLYCMYCVMTGANEEDLKENCPGPYRIDHDPEYD